MKYFNRIRRLSPQNPGSPRNGGEWTRSLKSLNVVCAAMLLGSSLNGCYTTRLLHENIEWDRELAGSLQHAYLTNDQHLLVFFGSEGELSGKHLDLSVPHSSDGKPKPEEWRLSRSMFKTGWPDESVLTQKEAREVLVLRLSFAENDDSISTLDIQQLAPYEIVILDFSEMDPGHAGFYLLVSDSLTDHQQLFHVQVPRRKLDKKMFLFPATLVTDGVINISRALVAAV